jgi:hypothetical protein
VAQDEENIAVRYNAISLTRQKIFKDKSHGRCFNCLVADHLSGLLPRPYALLEMQRMQPYLTPTALVNARQAFCLTLLSEANLYPSSVRLTPPHHLQPLSVPVMDHTFRRRSFGFTTDVSPRQQAPESAASSMRCRGVVLLTTSTISVQA